MPGSFYYFITAFLSLVAFFSGYFIAIKAKKHAIKVSVAALVILLFKALLHHKPSWEAFLFPWVNYIYFQSYWLYPLGLLFFGLAVPQFPIPWNRYTIIFIAFCFFATSLWQEKWMIVPPDGSSTQTADEKKHCKQTTQFTCAPAACVTMLAYWNIKAQEGEMMRLCLTKETGTSLFNIYRGLKLKIDRSLQVRILELTKEELATLKVPVIIGGGHARVVKFLDNGKVLLHDPLARSPWEMTLEEFYRHRYFDGGTAVAIFYGK